VEDARKCQAAKPGTDDRDWNIHTDSVKQIAGPSSVITRLSRK
jgi:hypothetical protein